MSGAQMAAGAAHDPANRDYTQIVVAENIIAVTRTLSSYAASRRPVPIEAEGIPILLSSVRDLLAGIEEEIWWTHLDSNQGPLACEASALTGLSYASTEKADYRAQRIASQVDRKCSAGR